MFQMHRIFCATPWELEAERYRFYDAVGQFNETQTMPHGVLYVPVTLPNVVDKRPLQYDIDQNIRECRHYILLLSEDWGPVERNFRNEYHFAVECLADPALPMQSVVVLAKKRPSAQPLAAGLPEPRAAFSTPAEFDQCLHNLMSEWLADLLGERKGDVRHATA